MAYANPITRRLFLGSAPAAAVIAPAATASLSPLEEANRLASELAAALGRHDPTRRYRFTVNPEIGMAAVVGDAI